MSDSARDRQQWLRYALIGNASFSIVTGAFILIAHDWTAHLLGLSGTANLIGLGIGLIIFAAALLINASRPELRLAEAWAVVLMDSAWVAGSYVTLLIVPLTAEGKWAIAMVADLVLLFAVLQWLGIHRIQTHERAASLSHGSSA
jgi:hypothetical protein